jgi:hypothetical protein
MKNINSNFSTEVLQKDILKIINIKSEAKLLKE